MILLAAAFLVGDAWAWNVGLRYSDSEGTLLDDRERWTVRVGPRRTIVVERAFLGTVISDGTLIASSDARPELLKGSVEEDGTLGVREKWSDPTATRLLLRLLRPDRSLDERVEGWPIVRRAILRESAVWIPGGATKTDLRIDVTLVSARLGGKAIVSEPVRVKAERAFDSPLES